MELKTGEEKVFQWDRNQILSCANDIGAAEGQEVHFYNGTEENNQHATAEVVLLDENLECTIPNNLLQNNRPIIAYLYITNSSGTEYTKIRKIIPVISRPRPEDIAYTDQELTKWEELEERINNLEESNIYEWKEIASGKVNDIYDLYINKDNDNNNISLNDVKIELLIEQDAPFYSGSLRVVFDQDYYFCLNSIRQSQKTIFSFTRKYKPNLLIPEISCLSSNLTVSVTPNLNENFTSYSPITSITINFSMLDPVTVTYKIYTK